jgi:hypothetical protein
MNKRGFMKGIVTIVLILFLIGLYYYTDQTKEILGMIVANWEPIKVDLAQKSITVQLSNLTNGTTQVLP